MLMRNFLWFWLFLPLISQNGQNLEQKAELEGEWNLMRITYQISKEDVPHHVAKDTPIASVKVDRSGKVVVSDDRVVRLIRVNHSKTPRELDVIEKNVVGENNNCDRIIRCIYSLDKDKVRVAFSFGVSRVDFHPYFPDDLMRPTSFEIQQLPLVVFYFERKKK